MTDKIEVGRNASAVQRLIEDLGRVSEMLESGYDDRENAEVVDKAMDILHMIMQWANAYPPEIFVPMTKEDWQQHHVALTKACRDGKDVRSGSAAAADCMRFVVTRMKEQMEAMAK